MKKTLKTPIFRILEALYMYFGLKDPFPPLKQIAESISNVFFLPPNQVKISLVSLNMQQDLYSGKLFS